MLSNTSTPSPWRVPPWGFLLARLALTLTAGVAIGVAAPLSQPAQAAPSMVAPAIARPATQPSFGPQAACQYVLGFKALHDQIPQIMGPCTANEQPAPNGDSLQTTENGLAVYRAADNWTAFTNGFRTWINGPFGVQSRLNTQRFPWEPDASAPGVELVTGSQPPPTTFDPNAVTLRLDPVWRGFSGPLALVAPPDGSDRLFVVEKPGTIRVIKGNRALDAPFLDIRERVGSSGYEQGLLGLAFDPQFAQNGSLYVNYTDRRGDTMVVRFTAPAGSDTADVTSAHTILSVDQPAANHNGGHLLFGPDGYLYIGLGDGGGAGDQFGNAQNPASLLGKMLRIDVSRTDGDRPYAIPPDNPFVGRAGWRPEIWAYGLRNPWRYTFDRATGDLYIADVGQNRYEEIDLQPAGRGGQNWGWPTMEASHCFRPQSGCDQTGLTLPIGEYGREGGCSVTGGYVYHGRAQPQLQGAYVFADFCSGIMWTLSRDAAGTWVQRRQANTSVQISSFGEDAAGEVYATGLGDGIIYRVVAAAR